MVRLTVLVAVLVVTSIVALVFVTLSPLLH